GVVLGDEALRLAESVAHPPSMISACWALGRLWRMRGELARAFPLLTRGVELSKMWHIRLWTAGLVEALGLAQLGGAQVSEALATLTQAVEIHESMRGTAALSVRVMTLGQVYLAMGRLEDADGLARRSLELALKHGERGHEAYAHWLVGAVAGHA